MPNASRPTRSPHPATLLAAALLAAVCISGCTRGYGAPAPLPRTQVSRIEQISGTHALLQAVSPVNEQVVWVSGHSATWGRTLDGGATWQTARVPGVDTTLQFRDVYGVDANTAYLMSAGNGAQSRIYKTTDGGQNWTLQFTNGEAEAFYDCMDFWDARRGLAVSDAVGGHVRLLATTDGGGHWSQPPSAPEARPGEGGFAASGTCLVVRAGGRAWIGLGNAPVARVLRTADYGATWSESVTPLPAGNAIGITSVSFRDDRNGVAMGGNVGDNNAVADVVAATHDGGATWTLGGRPPFSGAIFGGSYVPGVRPSTLVAVGPRGSAWSGDDGATWTPIDQVAYWAVAFASPHAGWAVGPRGQITKLSGF